MEEKLKKDYQLFISRVNGGKLSGSFVRYNYAGSLDDFVEVSPTVLASILYFMPTVTHQLGYEEQLVVEFDFEHNCYETSLEHRKTEGPYCEEVGYEVLNKQRDPALACCMTKLEESYLSQFEGQKKKGKEMDFDQKIKQGYELLVRHDGMGRLDAALILMEREGALDFIPVEEEKNHLMDSSPLLEKELYKDGNKRNFRLHYDEEQQNFVATIKKMRYALDGSNQVFWDLLEEVRGESVSSTFEAMEQKLGQKGKELKKCLKRY